MLLKTLGIVLVGGALLLVVGCGKEESDNRLVNMATRQKKLEREVNRIAQKMKSVENELDRILALAENGPPSPGRTGGDKTAGPGITDLTESPEYKQLAAAVSAIQQRLNVTQSDLLDTKEDLEKERREDPQRQWKALEDPQETSKRLDTLAENFGLKIEDPIQRQEFLAEIEHLKWINQENLSAEELSGRLASTFRRWLEEPEAWNDAWRSTFEESLRTLESPPGDVLDRTVDGLRNSASIAGLRHIIKRHGIPREDLNEAGLPDTSQDVMAVAVEETYEAGVGGYELRTAGEAVPPNATGAEPRKEIETEPVRYSPKTEMKAQLKGKGGSPNKLSRSL